MCFVSLLRTWLHPMKEFVWFFGGLTAMAQGHGLWPCMAGGHGHGRRRYGQGHGCPRPWPSAVAFGQAMAGGHDLAPWLAMAQGHGLWPQFTPMASSHGRKLSLPILGETHFQKMTFVFSHAHCGVFSLTKFT